MIQEPNNPILKNGNQISKVYFELLKKKSYPKRIDKILHGEKSQRSHIYSYLNYLERKDYVERVKPLSENERIKEKYWVSTYKPLFEYFDLYAGKRKETSLSDEDRKLTKKELKVLKNILSSRWFSRFFSDKYLKLKCDSYYVSQQNGSYVSAWPLHFLAFVFEEVCSIRSSLESILDFKIDLEEYLTKDFDSIIYEKRKLITNKLRIRIKKVKKNALILLGSYENTEKIINVCMGSHGFLFVPYSIANKLQYVARGGSTIQLSFLRAIEEINHQGKV